jgi:hypothetical protein
MNGDAADRAGDVEQAASGLRIRAALERARGRGERFAHLPW